MYFGRTNINTKRVVNVKDNHPEDEATARLNLKAVVPGIEIPIMKIRLWSETVSSL